MLPKPQTLASLPRLYGYGTSEGTTKGNLKRQHKAKLEQRTVDENGITHVGKFVELYHGTSRVRAKVIMQLGLRTGVHKQTMPGDPESSKKYVWLAKRESSAKSYSEMHARPVVITFRIPEDVFKQMDPYGRNSGPDSVWVPELPAKYVHSVV